MEELILAELKEIKGMLHNHRSILESQSNILKSHTEILNDHSKTLNEHTEILNDHSKTLNEHGRILSALKTGQEEVKAERAGMKLANANEFGQMKEKLTNVEVSIEILKDETWTNKKDIYRVQSTMGLK